jgi:hypothetical protein
MGTLRGDDGGGQPPDGGAPDGLPGLPPEWGLVVIPDDISALDEDAAPVQRQFRREARRLRWRRRLHLKARPPRRYTEDNPGLAVPLMIMSIAVTATLTSLFAIALPVHNRPLGLHPTLATSQLTNAPTGTALPDITLTSADGHQVKLRDSAPAAILVLDTCACVQLVTQTVTAAPAGVAVLAVAPTRGGDAGSGDGRVPLLVGAAATLRSAVPSGAPLPDRALVLLVDAGNHVVRALPAVSVDEFRDDLLRLARR